MISEIQGTDLYADLSELLGLDSSSTEIELEGETQEPQMMRCLGVDAGGTPILVPWDVPHNLAALSRPGGSPRSTASLTPFAAEVEAYRRRLEKRARFHRRLEGRRARLENAGADLSELAIRRAELDRHR